MDGRLEVGRRPRLRIECAWMVAWDFSRRIRVGDHEISTVHRNWHLMAFGAWLRLLITIDFMDTLSHPI